MVSGIIRHLPAAVAAVALSVGSALTGVTATADPSQDQRFFDLLGQKDIPPVDNENSLVTSAKKACSKLDDGMPVGDLVELIRNNGFNENPLTRLQPQDRITRTIDLFINASVEAYCPYDKGKIAGIAAYRAGEPPVTSRRIVLTSLVGPLPAGDIAPTKPVPIPAQPPPPVPQEIQPAPQQPPPPPRHAPPVPQKAPPPPEEPPPPAEAPQEPPPEAAPPAPAAPGGGA
ncbi:DUF732 domain-containing protein, partial [Mycobacterium cookii]